MTVGISKLCEKKRGRPLLLEETTDAKVQAKNL